MQYVRHAIFAACCVLTYANAAHADTASQCEKWKDDQEKTRICERIKSISDKFFSTFRGNSSIENKEQVLLSLYYKDFALDAIGRNVAVRALNKRTVWSKISDRNKKMITMLIGKYVFRQLIQGRFGKHVKAAKRLSMSIENIRVGRIVIVDGTIHTGSTTAVTWFLTKRDLKIREVYFSSGLFSGHLLVTYTSYLQGLANSNDRFISYKMQHEKHPGLALIKMLQDLIAGKVKLNTPLPGLGR